MNKYKLWFLFLLSIVLAYASIQGIRVYTEKIRRQYSNIPSSVSNASYLKAQEICGDKGIYSLDWRDFEKGQIKSIYCNW